MTLWLKGSRSFTLLLQNKTLSYLLFGCIISLLVSFCGLWLINHDHQQQQQQLISYHGLIVNKLTVHQLATTMANEDLIGMQSLLQRLTQQKSIVNAVIYDVDHNVIVQSGIINGKPSPSHQSFTTPIALENSLLGSLTTTIDLKFNVKSWLLIVIVIGSLLPFILLTHYLFKAGAISKDTVINPVDDPKQTTESLTTQVLTNDYGLLLVQIHDLDKISKQLNAQARNKEFETLDKLLKNILILYSGEKVALNQGCIVLKFSDKDKDKYLFNATCCAYLLLESAKNKRLFINLSAILFNSSTTISLQQEIPQLINFNQANKILINNNDLNCHLLEQRIIFEEIKGSHFISVTGFSESHQKLLDNQLKHLLSVNQLSL
jgi:uncharacterized membrane protein affecting hemolysin expression